MPPPHDNTNYALGSVLNHVLLHQTVEGLELKKQFEMAEDYPDVMFGCCGGGSNFPACVFPFVPDKHSRIKRTSSSSPASLPPVRP